MRGLRRLYARLRNDFGPLTEDDKEYEEPSRGSALLEAVLTINLLALLE
jgi:hypothetical protein